MLVNLYLYYIKYLYYIILLYLVSQNLKNPTGTKITNVNFNATITATTTTLSVVPGNNLIW